MMSPGLKSPWLGYLAHNDLRARMQGAAIFASPALYEPFGLSVLEAAPQDAHWCYPIFRRSGAGNGASVFVDPTDTGGLRHALAMLCADDAKRAQLQRAGQDALAALLLGANGERLSATLHESGGQRAAPGNNACHGDARMKCILFCHAFTSCWNNGNAHFMRIAREFDALGHEVVVYEASDGWSRMNASATAVQMRFRRYRTFFPASKSAIGGTSFDLDEAEWRCACDRP